MAKQATKDTVKHFEEILADIRGGIIKPLYVLMGDEPYYSDKIIEEISERAILPEERGFNQLLLYGTDVSCGQVIEAARRFPMMASRQLVIVREAQLIDDLDKFEFYCKQPMSTTILVISLTNKSLDKRGSFYKQAVANGVVFESVALREDKVNFWIERYVKSKGKSISPEASVLLADYSGNELRKLVLELDKLLTNLQDGRNEIQSADVVENIGISRDYNLFELTKAISVRDQTKIFKIASHFADSPKQYPLVVTFATIFSHFSRIVKYHAIVNKNRGASRSDIAYYIGINPFFIPEYEFAAQNYPLIKCMEIISLLRKYDSMSKSNERGEASDGELLIELVFKITH
ncbi:MAG: DNA polymerase III subunit delta [Bacteroidetes bacterium GWF2_40_14]|nr:MAG: DNA polymerase III subunit delta [Bacteroidetes bacterium GWF2_40_14]